MKPGASWIVLASVVLVALLTCSEPTSSNGTGSTTETAVIRGTLYASDGVTPAAGARVSIRPRTTLADTSGLGLPKGLADTATVTTDDSGQFVFDSTLDTGTYVIEGTSGNDGVLMDSVTVQNSDSTVDLPADTLLPVGALKGVVKLTEGGDPRKVFVLAFGIDRFASVDSLGRFRFQNLAEAAYDLRIISSLDDYGVLDMSAVAVSSADTTDLDTLELPFTGIPTVKSLSLSYDTLKQIVTLTWNRADTGLVSGYNVYRQHVDSGLVKLNSAVIADTVFRDSTALQDNAYTYQVKSVDKNGNEGLLSGEVGVEVVSYFSTVDSLSMLAANSLNSIALGRDGSLLGVEEKTIHRIGTNQGGAEGQWSLPDSVGTVYHVAVLDDSTLVVHSTDKLIAFSLSDSLIQRVWYADGEVRDVAYSAPYIYFIDGSAGSSDWRVRRINYDTDSTEDVVSIQSDFPDLDADLIEGLAAYGDTLAFAVRHYTDNRSRTVFSVCRYGIASGAKSIVHEMPWQANQNPSFTILEGSILVTTNNTGRLLQDQLAFAWTLPEYTRAVAAADLSTVYVAGGYSKVYVYSR